MKFSLKQLMTSVTIVAMFIGATVYSYQLGKQAGRAEKDDEPVGYFTVGGPPGMTISAKEQEAAEKLLDEMSEAKADKK